MEGKQAKAVNNVVVIDLIEIVPSTKGLMLYNPGTNSKIGSKASYNEHPFQGLVIKAPTHYSNGGITYESEFQEGDIVLLEGYPIPKRTPVVNLDGRNYPIIRYAEVKLYYTPTEKQRKEMKFLQDTLPEEQLKKKTTPIVKMN